MPLSKRVILLSLTLILGLLLQVGFIAIDCKETPHGSVIAFAKAYYQLDPEMGRWICDNQLKAGDENIVDKYIYQVKSSTAERGFSEKYTKYRLYHIKTETDYQDDASATVHLTGKRRMAINPLFAYVAGLFDLGNTYEVHESINVILKDGKWKVCGNLFDLPVAE